MVKLIVYHKTDHIFESKSEEIVIVSESESDHTKTVRISELVTYGNKKETEENENKLDHKYLEGAE